jgi:hypothetical protein
VIAEVARVVVQVTAGLFAGACLYILLVQHPVRTTLGAPAALDDFRATIPRAERLQAPLLVACLVAAALELALAYRWTVMLGALLMLVVLVQTLATVLPINRRLLSGAAGEHLGAADEALSRWGRLHAVRTVVAVLGAIALLV